MNNLTITRYAEEAAALAELSVQHYRDSTGSAPGRSSAMSEIDTCGWMVQRSGEDGPVVVECGAKAVVNEHRFECADGHKLIGPTRYIFVNDKSYRYIRCDEGFDISYLYQNVDPKKPWDRISVYGGLSETWGD